MSLARLVLVSAALVVASATPADAYLDPGSGSMLLQLLLGGFAGLVVLGKLYWRRLKGLVGLDGPDKGRP